MHTSKVSNIRSGNLFGGGDLSTNRIVPDLIKSYFENKKLIIRNPHHIRPWFYIFECIYLILRITDKIHGKIPFYILILFTTFLVAISFKMFFWIADYSPKYQKKIKHFEFIRLNKIDKLSIKFLKKQKFKEDHFLLLDNTKIKKQLNWKPIKNFDQNIIDTFNWYSHLYNNKQELLKFSNNLLNKYIYI